jgi:hypothetical protein
MDGGSESKKGGLGVQFRWIFGLWAWISVFGESKSALGSGSMGRSSERLRNGESVVKTELESERFVVLEMER